MKIYVRCSSKNTNEISKVPDTFKLPFKDVIDLLSQIEELHGVPIEASTNSNGNVQITIGDNMYEIT